MNGRNACYTCTSPERTEIESMLSDSSRTLLEISKLYGISSGSLSKHRSNHMSIGNGYLRPKLAAAATAATYIAPIPKWPHAISIVPICAECRAERLETGSAVPTSPAVQFVRINLPNFTFLPLCRNHAADYSWDPARVQRFQIM